MEVPWVTHIGDTVATLQDGQQHIILRHSSTTTTSNVEKKNIKQDLEKRWLGNLSEDFRTSWKSSKFGPDEIQKIRSLDWRSSASSVIGDWNFVALRGQLHGNVRDITGGLLWEEYPFVDLRPSIFVIC